MCSCVKCVVVSCSFDICKDLVSEYETNEKWGILAYISFLKILIQIFTNSIIAVFLWIHYTLLQIIIFLFLNFEQIGAANNTISAWTKNKDIKKMWQWNWSLCHFSVTWFWLLRLLSIPSYIVFISQYKKHLFHKVKDPQIEV